MMGQGSTGNAAANEVDAVVTFSPSGSGALTAASATLNAGATGTPIRMTAHGSVGAYVTLTTTGQQQIVATVAPNGNPTSVPIPPAAFPGPVGSVQIGGNASGSGTVYVIVRFRLK